MSQGRSRVYFSLEVAEIEASGSSVNRNKFQNHRFGWQQIIIRLKIKYLESVMRNVCAGAFSAVSGISVHITTY
ncbi:hypothetical protein INT80_15255 [Gallibacterium anatis]|uniref:Uncharacterized protein n=1 Tax=Gallibacterium anatis TaxID=750 RepID=A0A930UXE9_9PAST|nr:hypothetical protein [Gallibacterium anatis]